MDIAAHVETAGFADKSGDPTVTTIAWISPDGGELHIIHNAAATFASQRTLKSKAKPLKTGGGQQNNGSS